MTAARCVLVPSTVPETSSLVAREALACGTPAVAFPNGALPETIEHGTTGFLVRDVDEMAEAIPACDAIDPETCRRAARERFSLRAMTDRYLDLYGRLARSPGALRSA
jgi:glycosyltransferase involved in cell wall biosynthesis